MNLEFKSAIVFCVIIFFACSRDASDRIILGEEIAKKHLQRALSDSPVKRAQPPLIRNKETAIKMAEAVLFDFFGEKRVKNERPYESYLIDGYWIITGTLPLGSDGGTFEIMIDSNDGRIIQLTHYR